MTGLLEQVAFFREIRRHKVRFMKSCGFYACFFLIGLGVGIIGPTLIDLSIQTGTDLTMTSLILPLRAGGYVLGAFTCTFIYDQVNVLLSTIVTMTVSGLMMLLVPLLHNIWAVLSLFLILGFAFGVNEASVNIYIIHLWGKEVTPFMQALHFFFGLGALIAPLFTRPFILPIEMTTENKNCLSNGENIMNQTNVLETTTISFMNSTVHEKRSIEDFSPSDLKLIYPYAFVAVYSLFLVIWFVLMYIYVPNTDPHPTRLESSTANDTEPDEPPLDLTAISPRTPSMSFNGSIRKRHDSVASQKYSGRNFSRQTSTVSRNAIRITEMSIQTVARSHLQSRELNQMKIAEQAKALKWYEGEKGTKLIIVILANAFMHLYYGLELTFGSFAAPYSVNCNIHMNTREGAQLSSVFWAAFTFWRLFTIFYIGFTGPRLGIVINLCILAVGTIVVVPWGFDESWALYAGTILIGIGISPLWGSAFGFLELYFPVTSRIASSMMSSAAVGEFVYPAILARYMECQSIVFIYIILLCSASSIIVFSAILIICHFKMPEPENRENALHH